MDCHQAEGVGGVRTPIVVRPEPDVSIIVRFLFVVPADRVAAGFRNVSVEEDSREEAPSGFNSRLGRAGQTFYPSLEPNHQCTNEMRRATDAFMCEPRGWHGSVRCPSSSSASLSPQA